MAKKSDIIRLQNEISKLKEDHEDQILQLKKSYETRISLIEGKYKSDILNSSPATIGWVKEYVLKCINEILTDVENRCSDVENKISDLEYRVFPNPEDE